MRRKPILSTPKVRHDGGIFLLFAAILASVSIVLLVIFG